MVSDDGRFEWDDDKAAINAAKHGVTFEEASRVFDDPHEVEFFDSEHSEDECSLCQSWSFRQAIIVGHFCCTRRSDSYHSRSQSEQMLEKLYVEENS